MQSTNIVCSGGSSSSVAQAKTITSFSSASNHQTRGGGVHSLSRASSPLATSTQRAYSAAAIFNWELQQKFYFLQHRNSVFIELNIGRAYKSCGGGYYCFKLQSLFSNPFFKLRKIVTQSLSRGAPSEGSRLGSHDFYWKHYWSWQQATFSRAEQSMTRALSAQNNAHLFIHHGHQKIV